MLSTMATSYPRMERCNAVAQPQYPSPPITMTRWPLPASLASAPERSGLSAANTAVRRARAWCFAAVLEGAVKVARETLPMDTEDTLALNAFAADFLADTRRTARGAVMPGGEKRKVSYDALGMYLS